MKQTIKIEIECGEHTCAAVEPGKFCGYFGSTHHGSTPICFLFHSKVNEHINFTVLTEIDGWTQRCQQCKDLSK